jgi:hypothetical protein
MGGVFTLSAEDPGFEPWLVQTRLLVFASFQLSTQNSGARAKTGWLGIRIMYRSVAICLPAYCCFIKLAQ